MTVKEIYEKRLGDNNEIYLHCNKCNCTFLWTPYTLNRFKGEIGKLSIAAIEYTTSPMCGSCRSLTELFFAIRNLKEHLELMDLED